MRLAKFKGQLVDYAAAAELMLTHRDLSQRLTCPACAQHVDIHAPSRFFPNGGFRHRAGFRPCTRRKI